MLFKGRRQVTNLTKKSWELRCREGLRYLGSDQLKLLKQKYRQILKDLPEIDLTRLVAVLESKGAVPGDCIQVPRDDNFPRHVFLLRVHRWPQLYSTLLPPPYQEIEALNQLPWCATNDLYHHCINPWHWAKLGYENTQQYDSPPPPYSIDGDLLRPPGSVEKDYSYFSESSPTVESQETYGATHRYSLSSNCAGGSPWCKVLYWEYKRRVGRPYVASTSTVNILGDTPQGGDGLSIGALSIDATADTNPREAKDIANTRDKIGLGLVLYKDGERVWVYNRSAYPLFVNSPVMEGNPSAYSFKVNKLPPGHTACIFHYELARQFENSPRHPALQNEGPINIHSVRISFVKGYGERYTRQDITCCPCWIEIDLVPPR